MPGKNTFSVCVNCAQWVCKPGDAQLGALLCEKVDVKSEWEWIKWPWTSEGKTQPNRGWSSGQLGNVKPTGDVYKASLREMFVRSRISARAWRRGTKRRRTGAHNGPAGKVMLSLKNWKTDWILHFRRCWLFNVACEFLCSRVMKKARR